MFCRHLHAEIRHILSTTPAVVLLGPRQVGKTTLAHQLLNGDAVYLDLESPEDRAVLGNVEQYLRQKQGQLVVLDEVQRLPHLFEPLRGLIDSARRQGQSHGLYLLLGSASLDLLQHRSETLAGRVAFVELSGLHRLELPPALWQAAWLRGGFAPALLAVDDASSLRWRRDFIRTYLEREVLQFAPRMAAERLRRFWTMLAHLQGSTPNMAQIGRDLEVSTVTASSYLDLLVDLLLVRRLAPWHSNVGKRLVKTPKVYIRDTGLLHALLGIADHHSLLSHPVLGASWEGHVIESLLAVAPPEVQASHYRSHRGAEIDLLLTWPNGEHWAIEIKHSSTPKLARGFHSACADVKPSQKWLIYSGEKTYPLRALSEASSNASHGQPTSTAGAQPGQHDHDFVTVLPLQEAMKLLAQRRAAGMSGPDRF